MVLPVFIVDFLAACQEERPFPFPYMMPPCPLDIILPPRRKEPAWMMGEDIHGRRGGGLEGEGYPCPLPACLPASATCVALYCGEGDPTQEEEALPTCAFTFCLPPIPPSTFTYCRPLTCTHGPLPCPCSVPLPALPACPAILVPALLHAPFY